MQGEGVKGGETSGGWPYFRIRNESRSTSPRTQAQQLLPLLVPPAMAMPPYLY